MLRSVESTAYPVFENPFYEGSLRFTFNGRNGATRYDKWKSHLMKFAPKDKKAVDFLLLLERERSLILTEIKDFERIDKKGKYKNGKYSLTLCKDVAKKFYDTLEALNLPFDLVDSEERAFAMKALNFEKKAVFHWELKRNLRRDIRTGQYAQMKRQLKAWMHGLKIPSVHVYVYNVSDYLAPDKWWIAKRVQK